jgi:hypothetical protein
MVIALAAGTGAAFTQPPESSVEARLRALEARVSALEGRTAAPGAAAANQGVPCRQVELSGSWIPSDAPLTAVVNGTTIGTYDGNAVRTALHGFMRAGSNTVQLSFSAPGSPQTEVELRCMPPGGTEWAEILRLRPHGGRRAAESQITIVR